MRKLTANLIKGATGNKFLLINLMVNASAAGTANFCNTYCMRYAETYKGITIYEDEKFTSEIGISTECAKSAV